MKQIRMTIKGDPKSKKNSMQIIRINGKPMLIQSKAYRDYEKLFLPQIPEEAKQHISEPVQVATIFYRQTKQRVDLSNLIAAAHDLLVKGGVLEDDNRTIITSVDGSRVLIDKDNPRTEIIITILDERGELR